jgi:hypothetical protein
LSLELLYMHSCWAEVTLAYSFSWRIMCGGKANVKHVKPSFKRIGSNSPLKMFKDLLKMFKVLQIPTQSQTHKTSPLGLAGVGHSSDHSHGSGLATRGSAMILPPFARSPSSP